MPLRVAILTPSAPPTPRGNAVTVGRIARALGAAGVEVGLWDLSRTAAPAVTAEVDAFRPGLVHAFHAGQAGPLALALARRTAAPLVVTLTGTDANHDLLDPRRGPEVRRVLEGAAVITAFHGSMTAPLTAAGVAVDGRLAVVPQSVVFAPPGGDEPEEPAGATVLRRLPGPLFLFPAGIRPVKRPRWPLGPLAELAGRHPGLELVYVGPILDPDEGRALAAALRGLEWARHVGPAPHARMPRLLAEADVVLNCSLSEGGMANAILEALALGRAVLAADVPGNRSLVEHGVTGLLFATAEDFTRQAERLIREPALRQRLGEAGRARVAADLSPEREVAGYLAAYARATGTLPASRAPATG